MDKVKEALKVIEAFERALFHLIEACYSVRDLELTEAQCIELQKLYAQGHGCGMPEQALQYEHNYQDADITINELFAKRQVQEESR